MKLLVFHPSLAPYRVDFFNSLNARFNAEFYFFHKNVLDQKFNQNNLKKELSFNCKYLTKGISIFGRPFRFGIKTIIKNHQPDIVLCPEYGFITLYVVFIKFLFKKSYKVCTMCDDSITMSASTGKIRKILRAYLVKKLDGVILTNTEIVDWYNTHLKVACTLLTFPIIIDEEKYRLKLSKSITTANGIIEDFKLTDKRVLLFVGRLVTVKNLNTLIKVFNRVRTVNDVLVLVGSGYKENELKTLVNTLQAKHHIIFAGRQEGNKLLGWYTATQLFILASVSEAFGAVINEALISGSKILCSNLAGARCLINNDNGIIFNPYDEAEFAKTIKQGLALTQPIHHITTLRPSLMDVTYNTTINNFIDKLQAI